MTTPRVYGSSQGRTGRVRFTAKRLFIASIGTFLVALAVFYGQAFLSAENVTPFIVAGLAARGLMGVAVLLGVGAAIRKAQQ